MSLKWVSNDSFQSRDNMQILMQQGFITGLQSMDTDSLAYDATKTALYDGRVKASPHSKAHLELVRLERDEKTGKIDHAPNFSKDVSDAIAGVVYGLTMRREIWHWHGIPVTKIPFYLRKG